MKAIKTKFYPFSSFFCDISSWLMPGCCVLCRSPSGRRIDLCEACERDLPTLEKGCVQCAIPLVSKTIQQRYCGSCLKQPPPYHQAIVPFQYDFPVNRLISHLKFNNKLLFAKLLGNLLADYVQKEYLFQTLPELIVPVPLHPLRLRERGYNQALEIAHPIAQKLGIPIDKKCCKRIRHTDAQSSMSAQERHENIKGAFQIDAMLTAKHVAVVDDVMTTGSTLSALSHALRKKGVMKIDVWCCARTIV